MTALVFAHIPKTAGVSISSALISLFDHEKISLHVAAALPKSTEGVDLIVSHHLFPALRGIEGDKAYLTCVRDPASRLISTFRFWHSLSDAAALQAGNVQVLEVRRMTFAEFIASDAAHLLPIVDNGMVRHFTNVEGKVGERDLEAARRAIDEMSAIIVHEQLDATLKEFFDRIGCLHRFGLGRANVTDENPGHHPGTYRQVDRVDASSFDAATAEKLIEVTRYDRALYDYALMRRQKIGAEASRLLGALNVKRPTLAPGEKIVPSNASDFAQLLHTGWASPHSHQWTNATTAELRFRVDRPRHRRQLQAIVKISGCMIPNRDYILASVAADDGPETTVLFINDGVVLRFGSFIDRPVDIICIGSTGVEVPLDLDATAEPGHFHSVRIRSSPTSSPALLSFNNDERSLGIKLDWLKIV